MTDHHLLIEKLGRDLRPVKRPAATGKRLLVWLALALPAGIAASLLVPRTLTDWSQAGAIQAALQLMLAFILGLLAMRSALNLSIAGRRGISAKLLLPPGLLWLALSASSLLQTAAPVQEHDTLPCFVFLLVVSLPMLLLTIASLRRTRALYPARSLALAGLGVACMALSLLAFCHPVHLHALDLLQHLAAIACIIVLTVLLGRRWVRID